MGRSPGLAGTGAGPHLVSARRSRPDAAHTRGALVRPGLGIAYTSKPLREEGDAGARLLAERVRAALDPGGVLV